MLNKKTKSISLLFLAVCLNNTPITAQNKNYIGDSMSGYRGGYIKNLQVPDSALNFIVMGDWGRCGEYFQKEVGVQMARASVGANASFIIATGDNFYPNGVASVDDPMWDKSFENIYSQYPLYIDWYPVLGNHDYRTNAQAEIDYSKKSARWKMPARYHSFKMAIDGDTTQKALFVFIDTSPLIEKYYSDAGYKNQVGSQDTSLQKKWLVKVLSENDPNVKWKFVIGHHPLYTSGKRIKSEETILFRKKMEGIFTTYKVDAYLCGHEHQLEYIKPNGPTHHFISGAASEAREVKGKLPESKFQVSDHGFMVFSLTKDFFKVQTINYQGKILDQQLIHR